VADEQPRYRLPITDWAEGQRPREKLALYGAESLSDAELLAIIMRTGSHHLDAVAFGQWLLNTADGLPGLNQSSAQRLMQTPSIGLAKAASIKAAFELGRRLLMVNGDSKVVIRSAQDVATMLAARLRGLDHEQLHVVLLDVKNQVKKTCKVYDGNVSTSIVRPGEVFREAVAANATSIVIAHNHPSGDPTPSADDVRVTRQLVEAGKNLDIDVLDHLVIGDQRRGYVSLRERRLGFDAA